MLTTTQLRDLRDDIEGLKSDVDGWLRTVKDNRAEIPRMQRESLICERDIAVARLKIMKLEQQLDAHHAEFLRAVGLPEPETEAEADARLGAF